MKVGTISTIMRSSQYHNPNQSQSFTFTKMIVNNNTISTLTTQTHKIKKPRLYQNWSQWHHSASSTCQQTSTRWPNPTKSWKPRGSHKGQLPKVPRKNQQERRRSSSIAKQRSGRWSLIKDQWRGLENPEICSLQKARNSWSVSIRNRIWPRDKGRNSSDQAWRNESDLSWDGFSGDQPTWVLINAGALKVVWRGT